METFEKKSTGPWIGNRQNQVAFGADGTPFAMEWNRFVRLRNALTGKQITELKTPNRPNNVSCTPNGKRIATIESLHKSNRHRLTVWDQQSKMELFKTDIYNTQTPSIAISSDGTKVAYGAIDAAKVIDVESRKLMVTWGFYLAHANTNVAFSLWNGRTMHPLGKLMVKHGAVRCLAFSPNSDLLATGGDDGIIRIWTVPGR